MALQHAVERHRPLRQESCHQSGLHRVEHRGNPLRRGNWQPWAENPNTSRLAAVAQPDRRARGRPADVLVVQLAGVAPMQWDSGRGGSGGVGPVPRTDGLDQPPQLAPVAPVVLQRFFVQDGAAKSSALQVHGRPQRAQHCVVLLRRQAGKDPRQRQGPLCPSKRQLRGEVEARLPRLDVPLLEEHPRRNPGLGGRKLEAVCEGQVHAQRKHDVKKRECDAVETVVPVRERHPEISDALEDEARTRRIGQAVATQPGWDIFASGNGQGVHQEGGGMAVGGGA